MGKNATGRENLMLWGSTKCVSRGRKKLSYGGRGLLRLFINQKTCFRLVAQESIQNQLHVSTLPTERGLQLTWKGYKFKLHSKFEAEWANISIRLRLFNPSSTFLGTTKDILFYIISKFKKTGFLLQFWPDTFVLNSRKRSVFEAVSLLGILPSPMSHLLFRTLQESWTTFRVSEGRQLMSCLLFYVKTPWSHLICKTMQSL